MQVNGDIPRNEIVRFWTGGQLARQTPDDRVWMLSLWFRTRSGPQSPRIETAIQEDGVEGVEVVDDANALAWTLCVDSSQIQMVVTRK